jgi:hypothetical protein
MTPHHRRMPADQPRSVPPEPVEHDASPRPGPLGGQTVVDRLLGDDAEERDPPPTAGVRAWCPRPATPQELDDARTVLVVHRLAPRTGRCAACAADCPCPPALDAGRVLAESGAWNTVPFTSPAHWHTGQEPPGGEPARAVGWWLGRLARRLRLMTAAR